ncbi:hypothetical protein M413DRAFT_438033, partial [Hebeloma cylindrosporum]
MSALNKNNSAVKRIMQEARELANDPCTDYSAGPLEDDIFEWHCTLRGPAGTEFEGGLYHFRILLPAEYPFRPPSIMILTPNGRFELNTKICISFTNYHEELWQPAWGVRTAIIGLQGFFPLRGQAAVGVGSIEYPTAERKRLAQLSKEWICPHCKQTNLELLPDPPAGKIPSSDAKADVPEPIAAPVAATAPEGTVALQPPAQNTPLLDERVTISHVSVSPVPQRTDDLAGTERSASHTNRTAAGIGAGIRPTAVNRDRGGTAGRSQKPPLLLDTAICILLVLLFAIICRRI